jgi:FMN reductase
VYAASADWGAGSDDGHALIERIDRAAGELAALMGALPPAVRPDPFDEPTPFEELLARG